MLKLYVVETNLSYETVAEESMRLLIGFAEEHNDMSIMGIMVGAIETAAVLADDERAAVVVVIANSERDYNLGFTDAVQTIQDCTVETDEGERVDLQRLRTACAQIENKYR